MNTTPARKLNERIEEVEGGGWLFGATQWAAYGVCVGAVLLWVGCMVMGEPDGKRISDEDGFLEWGTVFYFGLCGVLSFAAGWFGRGRLKRAEFVLLMVFGVMCLVAIGEELSWGQRVFGLELPDSLKKETGGAIQGGHGDTSIHNLSVRTKYVRFSIGGLLFGVVLVGGLFVHGVLFRRELGKGKRWAKWLRERTGVFVPPRNLGWLIFGTAVVFQIIHSLRKVWDEMNRTQANEYKEFVVPAVYASMLVACFFSGGRRCDRVVQGGFLASVAVWLVWGVVSI